MYEFVQYRVRHVMTSDPVSIAPDAPVRDALKIFEERDFNALPVVAEDGRVVGLLSKLDALKAFVFTLASAIPRYDELI